MEKRDYSKIINMPYPPKEPKHVPMDVLERASIFSPFAALTGLDLALLSMQSLRCNRISLSEDELAPIHEVLSEVKKNDEVYITYFEKDIGPDGNGGYAEGRYVDIKGRVLLISPSDEILRVETQNKDKMEFDKNKNYVDIRFDDILTICKE